jgi:hypothetical protein
MRNDMDVDINVQTAITMNGDVVLLEWHIG